MDSSKKYNLNRVRVINNKVNSVTYKDKTISNGFTYVDRFIIKETESNREVFSKDDIVNIKLKENIYGIIKVRDNNYTGRISYIDINNRSLVLDISTENIGCTMDINIDDIEDINIDIF